MPDADFPLNEVQLIIENVFDKISSNVNVWEDDSIEKKQSEVATKILQELSTSLTYAPQRKWIVSCIIQQNCGAPFDTAAGVIWDDKTDGFCRLRIVTSTFVAHIFVYGFAVSASNQ
jgi:Tctex-1 family